MTDPRESIPINSAIKQITIKHTTNDDSMYGPDGPTPETDTDASAVKFEELVEAEILKQYPATEVTFIEGNGMDTKVIVDGDDDHEDKQYILWEIYHEVWEAWDWVVAK